MLDKRFYIWVLLERWIPTRAVICIMMFTACWTSYICRLQMPILAVPMIAAKANDSSSSGACVQPDNDGRSLFRNLEQLVHEFAQNEAISRPKRQDEEPVEPREIDDLSSGRPFDWSPEIRGQLLAAYAFGNVPGNLLGGIMAMKYGPRQTILWASLAAALLSLLSPALANVHWAALLGSRALVGLAGGVVFPACHTLVAKWSPPDEKSRFVWSLQGGAFGTIFTYPLIAYLAESLGWEAGWYLPSLAMLVWLVFWCLLAYDSPAEHPGISDEEKNYILASQGGSVRDQKPSLKDTPIKAIFTSVPFLCLVACHFGNLFLLFFYQNSMMLYLTKALGFRLTKGGMLASLPWLARIGFGFFFSWAGDIVRRRELVSLTTFRKCATIFSHFLPGVCLIMVGYVGCSFLMANVFLFLALGFNGAASIANLSNNQDLSPNYAGFLYGIMNTIGTTTGMIIPPMVEEIAGKYGNPIDRWQIVFWIGAGVCILSMIIFILGGSAKIQLWNEPRQREERA